MKNTLYLVIGTVVGVDDYKACLEDETGALCWGLPLALPMARSGSATALFDCLTTPGGCTSVSTSTDLSGSFETPHPYENDAMYMFEVSVPADHSTTWQFTEFEIDEMNDGTCEDEVYIFAQTIPLGPFCGFDDQFYAVMAGEANYNYDYYYENMLNTHNLGNLVEPITQTFPIRIGIKTGSTVNNWGFKFEWTTTPDTSLDYGDYWFSGRPDIPATTSPIRIEKNMRLYGQFPYDANLLDKTHEDYLVIKNLFFDFFDEIFTPIKSKYGYTIAVDIDISAPPNEGRRRRDQDDQPIVDAVVSFNGESNIDVAALTLDLEISTQVNNAYNSLPAAYNGLIATTYPADLSTQVLIVNSLAGSGCWACDSMSMERCILDGTFETCPIRDPYNSNPMEPVCFLEMRERDQRVVSVKTGCKDKHACRAQQLQNKIDSSRKDFHQCRPEYRLINRRYKKEPSVCRQCFTTCDLTLSDNGLCFGGMHSVSHASDELKRGDADWIEYPTSMATNFWNNANQFTPAIQLGIPVGTPVTEANDIAYVVNGDNKVFWGSDFEGTGSKTEPGTPADSMVYWGLHDQTIDWWMADLVAAQNVYYSRKQAEEEVFTT